MPSYSFLNVQCGLVGYGGALSLGNGSGVAEEGITVTMAAEKDSMTVGADGGVMHTLSGDKSGTVMIRLLRTSPLNYQLSLMYNVQTVSSALHGTNVITIRDTARGDVITCRDVAFRRQPTITYSKTGAVNEWEFNCGIIDQLLGSGQPALI